MEIVIPPFDLKSIAPMMSISIAAIFILLLDVFCRKTFKNNMGYISFLVVIATGFVVYTQMGQNVYSFSDMFVVDNFSVFFNLVFPGDFAGKEGPLHGETTRCQVHVVPVPESYHQQCQ